MPLMSRGGLDLLRATASGPAADEYGLTGPQPFSVLREVTRALQPVPLRHATSHSPLGLTITGLDLTAGSRAMLRRVTDPDVPLHVLGWWWDLSGAAPTVVPDSAEKEWTIGVSGGARRLDGAELPLVPARAIVGILAVRVILWQSDRGANPVELTGDVREAFRHTRLASVLETLSATPATMMTVVNVREAAAELGREIAPVLRALCTDYVDFFEGYYPVTDDPADPTNGNAVERFASYHSELRMRTIVS
jgi:hypothetical protein